MKKNFDVEKGNAYFVEVAKRDLHTHDECMAFEVWAKNIIGPYSSEEFVIDRLCENDVGCRFFFQELYYAGIRAFILTCDGIGLMMEMHWLLENSWDMIGPCEVKIGGPRDMNFIPGIKFRFRTFEGSEE